VTIRLLAGLAVVALVLSACSGSDDRSGATTKKTPTTTAAGPAVAPLTGLPDPSGVAQTRPVLSVKVENTPQVRPQAGLDAADIVWNEVVEGGITRFLAMFQSQSTDVVGPIRSVRRTDPLIVWPVGGVFAFSGGAPYALDAIAEAPVTLVDENRAGAAMFRDRDRSAPHNLFGRPDRLFAIGGKPVPPPPLFTYAPGATDPAARPATQATIGYQRDYSVTYTWDAASGSWLRATAGRPFTARDGGQIRTQNVVIMPVTYDGGVGQVGAEAQLIGHGTAVVLRAGTATDATWTRPSETGPMTLRTAAGQVLGLVPGRTWVELPDVSYPVSVVGPPAPPPASRP
jgi:Protein of unknown function (DUF3048) N-terminal domain/Protein of unknown function (DUF3048) C-terminal domain